MRNQKRCLLLALLPAVMSAQWLHYPTAGMPRTRDGRPNLTAPAPRDSDGRPNLSGLWLAKTDFENDGTNGHGLSALFIDLTTGLKPEDVSMEPWAEALFQQRSCNSQADDPIARCKPVGVPRVNAAPVPMKIVQTPGLTVILLEADNTSFRQIHTDGRKLPQDPEPSWMGYSTGKWEGNALVVETVGFHDQGWLDVLGHPYSDALHLTERFRRIDFGHLKIQITIDDRKAYKKPFTVALNMELVPDSDLMEYFCSDNERDAEHFVRK